MSTTAGYTDETLLVKRQAKAKALGMANRLDADAIAFMETVRAIKDNTTMTFSELMRSDKDVQVQVNYGHYCGESADAYDADEACDPTCTEPSTNAKTITAPTPIHKCFSIDWTKYRANEIDAVDQYMESRVMTEKMIYQTLSQQLVAQLELNLGTNLYTTGKATVAGTTNTINAAYWNATLIPDLKRTAMRNKFTNPVYLDSGLLWNQMFAAKMNAGNANGVGDAAMFNSIAGSYYADIYNIDIVNTPDLVMYMFDKGVIGLDSKSIEVGFDRLLTNPGGILDAAYVGNDQWRWSEPSILDNRFVLDVHRIVTCKGDAKVEKFDIILRPVWFIAPTGCTTTNTGILKFTCGS